MDAPFGNEPEQHHHGYELTKGLLSRAGGILGTILQPMGLTMNHKEPEHPETGTIPKAVKKSFINWLVPTLCLAVIMAMFIVARSWADDRYTLKTNADAQESFVIKQLAEEREKRETTDANLESVNRKLDLIIYILQNNGQISPNTMKGKLSQP